MKVTRNTPDHLIIANTPWFIGIMLVFFILAFVAPGLLMMSEGGETLIFGLIFSTFGGGIGVVAFCVFVRRVQVILDRPNNRITLRRQSVFGYHKIEHDLSDLSYADIEETTSRRDGRTSTLYRPVLVLNKGMSKGRHPIVDAYTNGGGSRRLVDAINAWIPAAPLDSDVQSA